MHFRAPQYKKDIKALESKTLKKKKEEAERQPQSVQLPEEGKENKVPGHAPWN